MTVLQRQCLLLYLGYAPGTPDGIDGPLTRSALAAFRADRGLAEAEDTDDALLAAVAAGETRPNFWANIRYFRREEFRCRCGRYCDGYPAEPARALVEAADRLRSQLGRPIVVSSGVRCPQHNANVGGVANSRHLSGQAMDFAAPGLSSAQLLEAVRALPEIAYAYAIDDRYVHMNI